MPVPAYLWTIMTWATFAISVSLLVGAAAALRAAGAAPQDIRRAVTRLGGLLIVWIAVTAGLSLMRLDEAAAFPGANAVIAFSVAAIFAVTVYRSSRRILDAVPQSWLIGIQAYRGLGAIFLVVYGLGALPGTFALPAGFGDWAVGILAVPAAASLAFGGTRSLAVAWNLLGIADLIIAVAMGVLNTPGLPVLPSPHTSNQLLVTLPLSMVPFYLVPLSFALHVVSLSKLARERRLASRAA